MKIIEKIKEYTVELLIALVIILTLALSFMALDWYKTKDYIEIDTSNLTNEQIELINKWFE